MTNVVHVLVSLQIQMAQLNMMYLNTCQGLSNEINWLEY